MTNSAHLLLGTNLGNKFENLDKAKNLLQERVGFVQKESSIYETEAWGNTNQPSFLNKVVLIETSINPVDLLVKILKIEEDLGRIRFEKWGERIIDIDILYYNSIVITEDDLVIPHPEIENRRFTLEPLVEISPEFIHPTLKSTNQELLNQCPDTLAATRC